MRREEAYLTTVGCRESESDNSWKWLQVRKRYRKPRLPGMGTYVVKRTKHWETTVMLDTNRKGTANLQLDQRLRYGMRDSDSFLWGGSPPHLIHQYQRPRGRETYKEIQRIAEARSLSTYRVSLHSLPSRWQMCSDSSPCRRRLRVAKVGNRVSYTDIHLR